MKKQKTWNCKECCRINSIKFDKCYSCGKPRSEVELLSFLDCFSGDTIEDRILEIEQKIIDEREANHDTHKT